jgi:uncharacterized protein (TIGR03067 family)
MRALGVALLGLVLVAGALWADDPTKQGPAQLQGTWKVVSAWQRGEQSPAERVANLRLVIEGDRLIIKEGDKPSDEKATFKLDPKQKPPAIDIIPDGKADRTVPGIYELKGDELKLCWNKGGKEGRPAEFVSRPDTRNVLWILKREKK